MTTKAVIPIPKARRDLAGFLADRRARLTPEEVGLPRGGRRRVPGLRREEVALLAGISVEYYARLERGSVGQVSPGVLDSLGRVLRLDGLEREHLGELVRTAHEGTGAGREGGPTSVRPDLASLLDRMTGAAAFVRNARLDVLAANVAARGLYAHVLGGDGAPQGVNLGRSLFQDPRSKTFYRSWERVALGCVGTLRAELARSPGDRELASLVAELRRDEPFRSWWGLHEVDLYRAGLQEFHHPAVGDLDLAYEALDVVADPGLTIVAYHPAAGSTSETALGRLVELAARGPVTWTI